MRSSSRSTRAASERSKSTDSPGFPTPGVGATPDRTQSCRSASSQISTSHPWGQPRSVQIACAKAWICSRVGGAGGGAAAITSGWAGERDVFFDFIFQTLPRFHRAAMGQSSAANAGAGPTEYPSANQNDSSVPVRSREKPPRRSGRRNRDCCSVRSESSLNARCWAHSPGRNPDPAPRD